MLRKITAVCAGRVKCVTNWEGSERCWENDGDAVALFVDNWQVSILEDIVLRRGTYKWKSTGAIYEGDWKNGKRNGFGVLSVLVDGVYKKQYSGGWKNDKRHGYGENWYSENEYYEGEWYADKRSGWGRMNFADDSVYEGEWYDDQRAGQGMQRLANDNRYEGSWKNGKKNGPGKFFYLDTGQLLEGVWVDDISKCGQITDFGREGAPQPTEFPIPDVKLKNAALVLEEAKCNFLEEEDF